MKLRNNPALIKAARDHYVFGGLTFDEIAEKPDMPTARTLRRWERGTEPPSPQRRAHSS